MTYKDILAHCKRQMARMKANDEVYEEHRMVAKLIEKNEKYRWHDLRENPEDLPKVGKRVDTRDTIGNSYYNWMDYYNNDVLCWRFRDGGIIAWREIEPFDIDPFEEM